MDDLRHDDASPGIDSAEKRQPPGRCSAGSLL